ncbi:HAD-like protein [Artomyces pyxidatus]|uniref:HAD-like protein n=1 Tax=Artomyces pyxidatus TaxID=48021 RepID=A0ACB8T515_9AGAM|nr:HAD-like protein [Artomyces pyxidatus]
MPTITVDAILFDMDGTLIDSTPGVLVAWDTFARTYHFDGTAAAHAAHGRRLADTLIEWCHISDAQELQNEIMRFEEEVIQGGPIVLPGGVELINQINAGSTDASPGWTIVTSATNVYTPKALARCGVPLPKAGYVTSDDVQRGKPLPDPYLKGAETVRVAPANCLVIEDAPSGLNAGRAAGAKVLAVCTSHSRDAIVESGAKPDWIVKDLTRVSARWVDGKIELEIDDSLW